MTDERKPATRHPSTAIPDSVVRDISHRVFLRRLEPPMDIEESLATTRTNADGKTMASDDIRRTNSISFDPLTHAYLRVLVDMGLFDDAQLAIWSAGR